MLAAGPLMIEGDDDEPIRVTRVGGYRLHICFPHREYRRENVFVQRITSQRGKKN
jgi:hypothetical protein